MKERGFSLFMHQLIDTIFFTLEVVMDNKGKS